MILNLASSSLIPSIRTRMHLHRMYGSRASPLSLVVRPIRLFSSTPQPQSQPHTNTNTNTNTYAHPLLSQISVLARIAAAAYVFQLYVANITVAIGPSMQPTLNDSGDLLITEALTPTFKRLRKGDVVVATKPTNPCVSILKRIRAMPGDDVDGVTVPSGHVWLQGDNPSQSTDSRHYGAVPLSLIRAKVWCRFWPPRQAQLFSSTNSNQYTQSEPTSVADVTTHASPSYVDIDINKRQN